ncbi:hypothetical protein CspeluHIS016_0700450 [Cutaneotrichosporon spelunceum]|uniref:Transmembrane protein n=1 Tax=Cutaneotrichosporon spelunceum TaxID=1672016 RepID=A0AAD3YDB7_9TREE|nr:hypothetical protein CspeluHIS016_0700450 [Cutaneotrichosporon spelunceum]
MRARPRNSSVACVLALALTLHTAAAQPVPGYSAADAASLYTVVDDETGVTREKGLSSGVIAGIVVAAVLAFSILFGLLWYRLDRQADRRARNPPRRMCPWGDEPPMRSVHTQAGIEGWTGNVVPRTSSTSTSNTTSSGSRTVVGTLSSSAKLVRPPSPAHRNRSDESATQFIQLYPPPKGTDRGRVSEWCAKAAAEFEGRSLSRVKSWEEGDPEARPPAPSSA